MDRRDFLLGTLAGVTGGVAIDRSAVHLEREAARADAAASAEVAASSSRDDARAGDAPTSPPTTAPPATIGDVPLGPQPPDGRQVSYAQQGEDLLLHDLLGSLGITEPRYLDIGAFHPTISSNTYLLYLHGASGVLVEPNPMMAKMLRELRPRDTVINAGVGIDETRQADYYVFPQRPQLNTFSKEQAERHAAQGLAMERVPDMPLRPVGELIAEHFETAPDLLSIDVEGLDLAILQTIDLERTRPAVLCVETLVFGTHAVVGEIADLLRRHDYVMRGGSFVNTVFVDRHRLREDEGARLEP